MKVKGNKYRHAIADPRHHRNTRTKKRNRQMRDAINKAARIVVNQCLGKIVFGWNTGQKDRANMGAKTNQKFASNPYDPIKKPYRSTMRAIRN